MDTDLSPTPAPAPLPAIPEKQPKRKKTRFKILFALSVVLLSAIGYQLYILYWKPDNFLRQIYLIPKDAIYIIESEDPIKDWDKFSSSKPWQYLKSQERMKEIGDMAGTLDSILLENRALMSLVGKRTLMISAHMTRKSDYDYLFILDLQKTSKVGAVKDQIENVFKALDYEVTVRSYGGEKIHELYDPKERTMLYMSFIDNHVVCSFTGQLVEKAIDEKDNPNLGRDLDFLDIEHKSPNGGLCKVYVNYKKLNNYLVLLTGVHDPSIRDFCQTINFTGLSLDASDTQLALKGYTNVNDSTNSYLPALLRSGRSRVTAQKVLSNRTAFFLNMGFDDAGKFLDNVEMVLKEDPQGYQSFKKTWGTIESFLKIDLRKNFLSWMDGEVAFAQNTPGKLGRQNEFVVAIKMKNKGDAEKNLAFIEEQVRKHTPVKFKTVDYEGYTVHYLEIKGFFRLLFGKLFDKLEKPYYSIVDNYVLFSNSPATLLSSIEDFRLGFTLENDEKFNQFFGEFNGKSSLFAYINAQRSFPLWREFVSPSTWAELKANENFVLCFPQTGFQLTGEGNMFDTRLVAEFAEPVDGEEDNEEEEIRDFASREDTLQNLERFYLEKMQGNVYVEYYDDGSKKSESEMENGMKNGKHRAYHPNGVLQAYGKFKDNKKNGTWRYYNEEDKLVRKERWDNGELKSSKDK